jgi:DNA polymerase III sliding clamp (beta) subunit (PCNA family)
MHFTKNELKAVLAAASKDTGRFNINTVYVESDRLVSTDGHRLHTILASDEERHSNVDKPFSIAREDAARILKAMGKNTVARIAADPDAADPVSPFGLSTVRSIDIDGASFKVPQIEGEFPNYQAVIPSGEVARTVVVNAKYLKELCQAALDVQFADHKRENGIRIEIREELGPISIETVHGDFKAVLMPMRDDR